MSTVCMPGLSWREALATIAAAGFSNVELMMIPNWVHLQPGVVPATAVLEECDRLGLKIVALHGGDLNGTSKAAAEKSLAYLTGVVHFAAELGVDLVNFNGWRTDDAIGTPERREQVGRIANALNTFVPVLEAHGVRATLENHHLCHIETPDDYRQIFGVVTDEQWVGATIDTGHFTSSGVDAPALVEELGARVFHVHMKDHIGTQSVGMGHGHTDNASVVAALKSVGYRGYLSVEIEKEELEPHLLREALPYVERLIGEA